MTTIDDDRQPASVQTRAAARPARRPFAAGLSPLRIAGVIAAAGALGALGSPALSVLIAASVLVASTALYARANVPVLGR